MTRRALLLSALAAACGRYDDFRLPPPETAGPRPPFSWEPEAAPVLGRGSVGDWDSVDVLNPSVIRFQNQFLNLYSGFDGHIWHTGLAISDDGVHWQKQGRVLSPSGWEGDAIAANGTAIVAGSEILYWYQVSDPPRIALARSRDGRVWSKAPQPVLPVGPRGSWDERAVADPYVIRAADEYYLFYLGTDRARRQRLGVAKSHDGITWEKLRTNPILELGRSGEFDEVGLGEPAVWSSAGSYWMLYTGRARGEQRRLGLAKSRDGVQWERDYSFMPVGGAERWNHHVLCDPSILVEQNAVRVWFGGGDVPAPDQNIHGQIGTAILQGG